VASGAKAEKKAFEGEAVSVLKVYGSGEGDTQRMWAVVAVQGVAQDQAVQLSVNGGEVQETQVSGQVTNDSDGNAVPTVTFALYGVETSGQISVGLSGGAPSNVGFNCGNVDQRRQQATQNGQTPSLTSYECVIQTQQQ
jgi:hypothetical protein